MSSNKGANKSPPMYGILSNPSLGDQLSPTTSTDDRFDHGAGFRFDRLPDVCLNQIFSFFSYQDQMGLRLINRFMNDLIENRTAAAFDSLGRHISHGIDWLDGVMPKHLSERQNHPFNSYYRILSCLMARRDLWEITYKPYMSAGCCCFPGKLLDCSFPIVRMVRNYIDQDMRVPLDVSTALRDVRDWSAIAVKHFDKKILPLIRAKLSPIERPISIEENVARTVVEQSRTLAELRATIAEVTSNISEPTELLYQHGRLASQLLEGAFAESSKRLPKSAGDQMEIEQPGPSRRRRMIVDSEQARRAKRALMLRRYQKAMEKKKNHKRE